MKSIIALTLLLALGSAQERFVSPYFGYSYPVYAPYANYVHAYNYPFVPLRSEVKVEKVEAPKVVENIAYTAPIPTTVYNTPYLAPLTPSYAPVLKTQEKIESPKKQVISYVAPTVANVVPVAKTHVQKEVKYVSPYTAPVVAPYYAAGFGYPANSQFHAQDELGNLQFGYSNINSARYEHGNGYSGVSGGYQYVDANGALQTVSYVADGLGFRTIDSRLSAGPKATPLKAPVFKGKPVQDTVEVAAAKAEFKKAYEAAKEAAKSN